MKFSELMARVAGRGVVVGEVRLGERGVDAEITGVAEDSRKVKAGDVFVARGGTKVDGAKFIADAIARGAAAVVFEHESPGIAIPGLEGSRSQGGAGVAWARVADANLAAALLAHEVAGNPAAEMKIIGITGTKGKTTVAYLMRSVLRAAGHNVGMIGTVEIDFGVKNGGQGGVGGGGMAEVMPAEMTTPGAVELVAMLSRMRANGVTHCVMEVSSHALHQKRVAGIDFAVGIFTNLTGDHLDYHKTMEEYAAAKAILFAGLKEGAVAVVNADDEWAGKIVSGCRGKVVTYRVLEGLQRPKTIKLINLGFFQFGVGIRNVKKPLKAGQWETGIEQMTSRQMRLSMLTRKIMVNLDTALIGRHNAANATAVLAACVELGVHVKAIRRGLTLASGAPGRLQRVEWEGDFQVFVDYAHTHDALENVLTALRWTMRHSLGQKSAAHIGDGSRAPSAEHAQGPFPEHGTREAAMGSDRSRDREGAVGAMAAGKPLPDGRGSDVGSDGKIGGTPMPRLICVFGCGGDRDRTKRPKMGAVAEWLADVVIVTSDNPRAEVPGAIIQEICAGFSAGWKDAGKISVEPDRRAAIRMAISEARAGDVVLIAGKGHENYQIIGTVKHHFDDVEEAEAALRTCCKNGMAKT